MSRENFSGVAAITVTVPSMTLNSTVLPSGRRKNQSPNFDTAIGETRESRSEAHGESHISASLAEIFWMSKSSQDSLIGIWRVALEFSERLSCADHRGGGERGNGMAGSSHGKHRRQGSPGGWNQRLVRPWLSPSVHTFCRTRGAQCSEYRDIQAVHPTPPE